MLYHHEKLLMNVQSRLISIIEHEFGFSLISLLNYDFDIFQKFVECHFYIIASSKRFWSDIRTDGLFRDC